MTVNIPVKNPLLRAYLPMLFALSDAEGVLKLNQRCLTGTIIFTLLRMRPIETGVLFADPPDDTLVCFEVSPYLFKCNMQDKCLYVSKNSVHIINRVLKREFDMCFLEYWTSAIAAGLTISQAVESFIVDNQLDEHYLGDIDALYKRVIRYRLDSLRQVKSRLKRSIYYRKKRTNRKKHH